MIPSLHMDARGSADVGVPFAQTSPLGPLKPPMASASQFCLFGLEGLLGDVVPCGPTQAGISAPFCESHLHHNTYGVWQRISQDAATEGLLGPLLREATGLGNQISSSPEPTSLPMA
ncbi:unnamed protein product [Rangifer tarandus platyrhynchus]|uniref:Uncharacterized protein n=1 Tax=Rangifer tarandus platyrhynchus TaxID=3082113 RepID=A0AC59YEB6_RANTA